MRRWLAAHGSSGLEERAKDRERERVERHVCVRAAGIVASVRDVVSVARRGRLPRGCVRRRCMAGMPRRAVGSRWKADVRTSERARRKIL